MRRRVFVSSMIIALLLSSLLIQTFSTAAAAAQDATPPADPMAGTTIEVLGGGPSALAGDHNLVLMRITMEPRTLIPPHRHPGEVVLFIQSGTFGTTFVDGSGVITRASTNGTPAATEAVSAGSDNILEAGDSLAYSEAAAHTMANPGDEPLVLLVSALLDPSKPGFMWFTGTPTP